MKANRTRIIILVALLLGVLLGFSVKTFGDMDISGGNDFYDLRVFAYGSGLTGFFNAKTGMLYIYDTKVHECMIVRQMVEPGRSLIKIK